MSTSIEKPRQKPNFGVWRAFRRVMMVNENWLNWYKSRVSSKEKPLIYVTLSKSTRKRDYFNGYLFVDGEIRTLFWDEWSDAIGMSRIFDVLYNITKNIEVRYEKL